MSIRLRITVTLTLIGVVMFGTYAVLAYRGEREDLRTAAIREIRIIGRTLETSLGNALRDRKRADIDESLTTLESIEPNIDIHLHEADGRQIAHSQGAATDQVADRLAARAATARTELTMFEPEDDPTRLVFAAPVIDDDGTLIGSMAIVRPVTDLDADLARTRWRLIAIIAAFLAVTMVAGLVLGTAYVTRPVAAVLEGVRQIRHGEFRSPVPGARNDEIGALIDEFNAMVAALAEARGLVEQETEARLRLERGLQGADKLITIGQLSAGLAHEIGSPLQVLTGRAQALVDHADPEVRRQGNILVEQSERIARIVEQLLSFGRRRPAVIASCDLGAPVRNVLELLAGEARRRGIQLQFEADGGDHRIQADADQLQQVALNLIKNALAATSQGGTIAVQIEIPSDGPGDTVNLIVRDTGIGIPSEIQGRLFEPFFTTRASEGGTGLGLAVVRAIVDEHGGTILVKSQPGHGAELIASFPRHAQEPHG
jgi:signal transduction histidine kinase